MASRYKILNSEKGTLWTSGSPVLLSAFALVEDTEKSTLNAQLKFQVLSEKPIESLTVSVACKHISGEQLSGVDAFTYAHISKKPGETFGDDTLIALPDRSTYSYEIEIKEVFFSDGSSWQNKDSLPLVAVKPPQPIDLPAELMDQYLRDTPRYMHANAPEQHEGYWWCECGQLNIAEQEKCIACGKTLSEQAAASDKERLAERLAAYQLAQSQNKAVQRKKITLLGIAAGIIAIAVLAFVFVINPAMERAAEEQAAEQAEAAAAAALEEFRQNARSVGGNVYFGSYDGEALQWRVLAVKDGKALLITEGIIAQKPYNDEDEGVTWGSCTLRKWLNKDFLSAAFSSEQIQQIELTNLDNPDNPKYHTDGGSATDDYVFLLSIDEAEQYFSSRSDRIAKTSDERAGWWWLRSPGDDSYHAAVVLDGGAVLEDGWRVNADFGRAATTDSSVDYNLGVRPALWLNLES
jgi:type II secretory pathway pseudopilin PulG